MNSDQMNRLMRSMGLPDEEAGATQTPISRDADTLIELLRDVKSYRTTNRPKIRAIGERLYFEGGWLRMHKVAMEVRRRHPHGEGGEEGWHPHQIDFVWSGIGEWLP